MSDIKSKHPYSKLGKGCLLAFFAITWILCASYVAIDIRNEWNKSATYVNPYEYSRWVMAYDRSKTAILVRKYGFDLNFLLFIQESGSQEAPTDRTKAIWISHDYDPSPYKEWGEDIKWSGDSSIVAVKIDNEYVFSYDFNTSKQTDDPEIIKIWLKEHDFPPTPED